MERFGLTAKEAAAMLGLSVTSIHRAIKRGELHAEIVSGVKVIPARELVERFGEPVEVSV